MLRSLTHGEVVLQWLLVLRTLSGTGTVNLENCVDRDDRRMNPAVYNSSTFKACQGLPNYIWGCDEKRSGLSGQAVGEQLHSAVVIESFGRRSAVAWNS